MEASKRQSLALLFCDIAGTSSLMAREGDLAVANLVRALFENAGRLAVEHHCGVMKFIGDGFMAAFDRVEQALPFVSAVQNVAKSDPSISEYLIGLRFSLHFGDVLCIETSYGRDILGQEITIAARLNDLAASGQLVISEVALQQLSTAHRAGIGPRETANIKTAGEIQIHRLELT